MSSPLPRDTEDAITTLNAFWNASNTIVETGRRLEAMARARDSLLEDRQQLEREIKHLKLRLEEELRNNERFTGRLNEIQSKADAMEQAKTESDQRLKKAMHQILLLRNECQRLRQSPDRSKALTFALADAKSREASLQEAVTLEANAHRATREELNQANARIAELETALKHAHSLTDRERKLVQERKLREQTLITQMDRQSDEMDKLQTELGQARAHSIELTEQLQREQKNQMAMRSLIAKLRYELSMVTDSSRRTSPAEDTAHIPAEV